MYCKSCGKEIKDGSKFCKYCGAEIKNDGPSTVTNVSTDNDAGKKAVIGVLVAVIIILAIVMGALGLGLFDNIGGSDSADVVETPESEPLDPVSLNNFPVSRAPDLAEAVKNSNGNFPVQFESLSLSKAQCQYILTKSVYEIGSGHPDASFSVGNPSYASNPSGRDNAQSIPLSNYVDMSKRFSNWIESHGSVPNYIGVYSSGVPDVSPSRMLDIEVNVLMQYESTGSLPSTVNI